MPEKEMGERERKIRGDFDQQFGEKDDDTGIFSSKFFIEEIFDEDGFVIVRDHEEEKMFKVGMKIKGEGYLFDDEEDWVEGEMKFVPKDREKESDENAKRILG